MLPENCYTLCSLKYISEKCSRDKDIKTRSSPVKAFIARFIILFSIMIRLKLGLGYLLLKFIDQTQLDTLSW